MTTMQAGSRIQGDHSPGKPGKVREFQRGQGKVRGSEIRCVFFKLSIHQNSFKGRVSAPDPAGGAYDAPPDSLVGWGEGHPIPSPSCYNPNC